MRGAREGAEWCGSVACLAGCGGRTGPIVCIFSFRGADICTSLDRTPVVAGFRVDDLEDVAVGGPIASSFRALDTLACGLVASFDEDGAAVRAVTAKYRRMIGVIGNTNLYKKCQHNREGGVELTDGLTRPREQVAIFYMLQILLDWSSALRHWCLWPWPL